MVLSAISLLSLLLPADSGEKIGLSMTVLLALIVFLQLLQEHIPVWDNESASPVTLQYFVLQIIG